MLSDVNPPPTTCTYQQATVNMHFKKASKMAAITVLNGQSQINGGGKFRPRRLRKPLPVSTNYEQSELSDVMGDVGKYPVLPQ